MYKRWTDLKIYVVGIGPGRDDEITLRAKMAIDSSDVIVGYKYYMDLIEHIIRGKEVVSTGMKGEVERCNMAVKMAMMGKKVCVVSSGDAGVYGMASIVIELAEEYPNINIEVIPGVTAACSGAAVVGAPIAHDFAVISLSDLLTPWNTIEMRIKAACMADFVICFYNPSSKKRIDYLQNACDIIISNTNRKLWCAVVRNIGREGESSEIMTITKLRDYNVDMFTTVYIGNSNTRVINGRLVTPRGYIL